MTPYAIAWERAFEDPRYSTITLVCGSQMGKSEAVLDVVGHRFDQRPTPAMYVGPSQDFIVDEIEPRLMDLINTAKSLSRKLSRGKKNKRFRKVLGGVPIRLAWAGSPTQLSGTSAGLVMVDEYDRMMADVKGEGDPLGLVEARGFAFRDRKYGVTSTPLLGLLEVVRDPKSGLEFWKRMPPEDIQSPTWALWQSGTMYHWAWPCPHCDEFFIPRHKNLVPNGRTPSEAKRRAFIACPRCGGAIEEHHKAALNKRGVYVAPGQSVLKDGTVVGSPPESTVFSVWVSGLCSPFVTIGERAASWLRAQESGDAKKIQTCLNTGFGELYSEGGGDAPETAEVGKLKSQLYRLGDLPAGTVTLTCAIDVQGDGLYYVTRAWGARATSWLVDRGFLEGSTAEADVWDAAADLITTPVHGYPIKRVLIDSGFRPGKPSALPSNRIYDFCRRFPRLVWPSKGRATQSVPVRKTKLEVTTKGGVKKHSLELLLLDTDYFKSWVHERIRWPVDKPGSWSLPDDVGDDYCAQIVSESRVKKPSGQVTWIKRRKDNHYLDCEAMNAAAGYMLNVTRLREGSGLKATLTSRDANVAQEVADELAADAPTSAEATMAPLVVTEVPQPKPVRRRSWADIAGRLNT